MSDDLARLRSTLDQLHEELARIEPDDPEIHALLSDAVSDIQSTIGKPGATSPADESVVDRLREAAERYETSHPTLSGILGSIIDTLSRMGI